MATALGTSSRLGRAGAVLAQHGVRFVPQGTRVPFLLRLARAATLPIRILAWPLTRSEPEETRVTEP